MRVVLKGHHEAYIEWSDYERNQEPLAANAYGKAGRVKSGRGSRALPVSFLWSIRAKASLSCMPGVAKVIRYIAASVAPHDGAGAMHVVQGFRTDAAVTREALDAVAPMAVEAALEAERMQLESEAQRHQMNETCSGRAMGRGLPSAVVPPAAPRTGALPPSSRRAGKPRSRA
ncbi:MULTISPECIES: hypothetical protein [unclassified Mesorhizobium]|uniref:hypothetical protein n=1 Tax=unclassified Mesorhizobium TaxID=325217 RepID=UPI000F74FA41|nr:MULTISPECIES: hypothetical protein [unclassified Mesorhizobium]AZO18028.1 hypothetical protein EJ069_27010 [Mesorhizobium sp. M2A.F.Ca.ET.043.05.1.1]RVB71261.1 hypothetical protein EN885_32780 [Mesorhizobium sp. M6A.T.Cr.TU.014.01.1.1]RWP94811.1 MAG: hypothetical protein EOR90_32565 [Mesorhizobium sp.]